MTKLLRVEKKYLGVILLTPAEAEAARQLIERGQLRVELGTIQGSPCIREDNEKLAGRIARQISDARSRSNKATSFRTPKSERRKFHSKLV